MTSISLDQTESEKRLHRILYYVKVLRAQILRSVLIILAIGFYMAFGITGLDPAVKDGINTFRPYVEGPERSLFIVVIVISTLLFFGFVVWLCMSIVRVWRKSLKAQSI